MREGIFPFYVDMKCRNRKTFLSVTYFCSAPFLSLFSYFFLSFFLFLPRNVPFSTRLFISLRLSSLSGYTHTVSTCSLITYLFVTNLYCLSLSFSPLSNHNANIYLSKLYTNLPMKIKKKRKLYSLESGLSKLIEKTPLLRYSCIFLYIFLSSQY